MKIKSDIEGELLILKGLITLGFASLACLFMIAYIYFEYVDLEKRVSRLEDLQERGELCKCATQ